MGAGQKKFEDSPRDPGRNRKGCPSVQQRFFFHCKGFSNRGYYTTYLEKINGQI